MKWEKSGFDDFMKGTLGNGGQNLYVSANGVLQRIYSYDINNDGYADLLFANSQSMGERPNLYIYNNPIENNEYFELPSEGSYDAVFADIDGDGFDDLIIGCQNNGTHNDITAIIYYGSEKGLSEKYRVELPAPNVTSVAAGDFNGDGKIDIAFLSNGKLRVFWNTDNGITFSSYEDYPCDAIVLNAGDIDEDGYCDLYIKNPDGSLSVLWGSEKGDFSEITNIFSTLSEKKPEETTTEGRRNSYYGWRPDIIKINGNIFLFASDNKQAHFFSCKNRKPEKAFSINCENAISVSGGDIDGDGLDDIAVAVFSEVGKEEKSYVYWQTKDGFINKTEFETVSARNLSISDLGDGKKHLLVCCGGTQEIHLTSSLILSFDKNRSYIKRKYSSGDAVRFIAGKSGDHIQLVSVNHELGRVRGDENIMVYLGGPDGFNPERKLLFPGYAAVDGLMADFNDDGYIDVFVCNCSENDPEHDPGSFLYWNGPNGFDINNRTVIPSVHAHGEAIGDFRKSGYLDIAVGGFSNREIFIFKGGKNGIDTENPQKILLGPKDIKNDLDNKNPFLNPVKGDSEILRNFGEVRWLFTADFNNDGWLDLFISEITGDNCFILWGGPEGFSSDRMQILATECAGCANVADLDGDEYPDLILGGHVSNHKSKGKYESYITVYWGGQNGYKENRKMQLPTSCSNSITIGDFNGDGRLDIYGTAYNNGRNRDLISYLYFQKQDGSFSVRDFMYLYNHSGSGCVAGDFNGDGYTDLAVACHKTFGNHLGKSYVFWGGPDGLKDDRKTELPTIGPHGMTTVDPGNVMDRSNDEYYYSEPFKTDGKCKIKNIDWTSETSRSNSVTIQIRCADSLENLYKAEWSDRLDKGEISEYVFQGIYIQYRLILSAKCSCGTPRVSKIEIDFD